MKRRMFECVNDKSCKFWEVWLSGSSLFTRYGKIGVDGQVTEKNYDSKDTASQEADKIIKQKIKKGYVEV